MSDRIDDSRLYDFLEGLAAPEEARAVEAALAADPELALRLETLRELLSELADLPPEAEPARDLWPDIAARMEPSLPLDTATLAAGAPEGTARTEAPPQADAVRVIPLAERRGRTGSSGVARPSRDQQVGRRFSFTLPQLAAASIVLAFASGATVWMALRSDASVATAPDGSTRYVAVPRGGDPADAGAPQGRGDIRLASRESGALDLTGLGEGDDLERATADLEQVLIQGRDLLAPETLQVVEASLATIDRAIDDARRALQEDPGSPALQRLLTSSLSKKLTLLRHTARAIQAAA